MRRLGLLLLWVLAAKAQTTLTLADAEALALKNHPQVQASEADYLRSDQTIRQQESAYYPAINGNITGSQANRDARIGAGQLTASGLFSRFGYGITLSQLITDSGRTSNLVKSSQLQAQASRQDYQAAQDGVILGVRQAFYGVLRAQAEVRLAQGTLEARESVVNQVSELARNKLKSGLDLSFTQANLSDAKLMLLRAQNDLAGANAELMMALGSQNSGEYRLVEPGLPEAPASGPQSLVDTALSHRPELASFRLQEQAGLKFAQAERDLRRPTVSLTAVAGFLPFIVAGNANPNIASEYEGAEVNVQIPIFNGHLFGARAKAAEYAAVAANRRIRDLEDRIAKDVRSALGRADSDYQAIAASRELLKQSNSALDLAQGRYNLGLSSIVELTQAELLQTQAQVQVLNAQFEYQQAYAALQYAQGLLH